MKTPEVHKEARSNVLWDIPTRVFHWLIVLAIPLAWWTAEEGEFDRHQTIGFAVLVLVCTRLLWGFVGSKHSRFSDFVRGPARIAAYLRGGESGTPGHNPLGALSVLALLFLLFLQAFSGLFNTDDVLFEGPFYFWADSDFRNVMGEVHDWAFNGLLALIAMHIAAVAYYQFKRKQPLLQAMIKGRAEGKTGEAAPAPWWGAVLIVLALAALLYFLVSNAPQPESFW